MAVFAIGYVTNAIREIDAKFAELKTAQPTKLLASHPDFVNGMKIRPAHLKSLLLDQGYREIKSGGEPVPGEFMVDEQPDPRVLLYRPEVRELDFLWEPGLFLLDFDAVDGGFWQLIKLTKMMDRSDLTHLESMPKRIGSYYAGRVRTQSYISLSDIPTSMRLAVMAIEDKNFLEHGGVSIRSTLRALWKDIKARRWVEGGSTLTQQLMKNLFFSRTKSLDRKFKEALYALVVESRYPKEAILEAYLNEIYLGQWGTHEIHGVSEGAQFYFSRPISQISLAQAATIAAIIQAPNAQDPQRFPQRIIERRNLVLKRMADANFILPDEAEFARSEPLGVVSAERSLHDVDYFTDFMLDRMSPDVKDRLDKEPMVVYTTLNPYLQSLSSRLLNENLQRLKKNYPSIAEREKKGKVLQAGLVAIDVKECSVIALQGGHSYRATQFNRILQGKRQPGSLFKPFVFLAGFDRLKSELTPITEIEDGPFEWKYDKQIWKPKNYEKEFRGKVTARETLELSLNTPTARVAQMVGIPAIIETLGLAGIRTPLKPLPSVSLGGQEVTPLEVAEAYLTMAGLGQNCALRGTKKIAGKTSTVEMPITRTPALNPAPTYQTINVLKGVFNHGTARAAQSSGIPLQYYAGKTGTTNEANDAWFVGFSPSLLVLVWVGYDSTEKAGLTGAAAALPLWVEFVKEAAAFFPDEDFKTPEDLNMVKIDRTTRKPCADGVCTDGVDEYFAPGTQP